ncbi:MAG: HlyD family efflux transporter periplasmic adaptor subunit [Lachnospiraceae bacterium]|nr:HlyD family efflux transporter periplasmic adaptor subunit [Lachnospiraceae bacterium]
MSKKPVNRKQTTQTKKQPAREQQTGRRQAGKQQAGQQSGKQQSGKKKQRKGEERTATANLNIGTFIYIMIAIYLFVSLVLYLTAPHITSYQVKSGPLSQNEVYTAIALREEQVVNSSGSGYISYFTGDSSKVAKNGPICCVSDNREMFSSAMIDKNNIASEHNLISKFAKAYNSNDFGSTYNLKYALRQSTLYSSQGDVMIAGMQLASQDGVVAYTTDGYEYVTAESLTAEEFRPKTYSRQNLQTDDKIVAGTPLYRLITSDTWSICIPVTQKQSARLEEYAGKVLKVRFLKDGQTERGEFSLEENGNQRFAKLTFYSGMIRYCDDRYLEVELITNIETGLKIPVSSLVQKEFYLVPELYRYSDENGTAGFTHCYPDKNGTEVSEFISPVCYEDKQIPEGSGKYYYFLDKESVSEGDVMIKPDSQERYTIGVTEKLQGVYCINKGYTVFRKVEIIDQNEEYAIVKSGTRYGIEQFDFIVRDSSTVKESDILYR